MNEHCSQRPSRTLASRVDESAHRAPYNRPNPHKTFPSPRPPIEDTRRQVKPRAVQLRDRVGHARLELVLQRRRPQDAQPALDPLGDALERLLARRRRGIELCGGGIVLPPPRVVLRLAQLPRGDAQRPQPAIRGDSDTTMNTIAATIFTSTLRTTTATMNLVGGTGF